MTTRVQARRVGSRWLAVAAVGCSLLLGSFLAVSPTLAQSGGRPPERLDPPVAPASQNKGTPWYSLLIGIVLIGMIVGANLIPSKRGHQD